MLSLIKKYKHIFVVIIILIISALTLLYRYSKPTSSQSSLLFKVNDSENSQKQTAAILLLTPTTGQFYIGDIVTVALVVNTLKQSINTVGGKVIFPLDKLEVTEISKTNSIISLWIQEPIASSSQDFIDFLGGLPEPGFIGTAGQIINISFKVKSGGDAIIGVKDAYVLANDGFGTDILTEITPTKLTLSKPKVKKGVADVNRDGKIDLLDVSVLLSNWGTPKDQRADLNRDGKVDAKDLSIILSRWSR